MNFDQAADYLSVTEQADARKSHALCKLAFGHRATNPAKAEALCAAVFALDRALLEKTDAIEQRRFEALQRLAVLRQVASARSQ